MKKAILYISALLLIAYTAAAFFLSDSFSAREKCRNVYIDIEKNDSVDFVSRKLITQELRNAGINLIGNDMGGINTQHIENTLKRNDYIEDVQCYATGIDGIRIDIAPIKPIIRLFKDGKSYYMNRQGKLIKSDERIFIDLPVVTGKFTEKYPPTRLIPMMDYIESTPVLRNLVSMVQVNDSNNIYVIPNIAGHVVNMGSVNGYESKFAKLLRMYREVMPVKGWDTYDTISVKWDHQIVAKKRYGGSHLKLSDVTDENDDTPDVGTMSSEVTGEKPEKENKNN